MLPRLLSFGFVAVTAGGLSLAWQPAAAALPRANTTGNGLQRGDARLVAWAAHDAVASRDRSQIPQLLSLASNWRTLSERNDDSAESAESSEGGSGVAGLSAEQMDGRDAMAEVVDALIQMKVAVPADTLRALARDFGSDVAVLLSRMPPEQSGALSFEFYRQAAKDDYGLQYVSAALLALHPVPGFAADLIANVRVRGTVFVVLPGAREGWGNGSSGCGGSWFEIARSDWPMIGQYGLSAAQYGDGGMLLVEGSDPVYATRFEAVHYRGPRSAVILGSNERVRLIAEMLGISPEEIPWKTAVETTIEFESLGQFESVLTNFVGEQQEKYRDTVAALETRKLLTAGEVEESLPQLELTLNDMRGVDAEPIAGALSLPSRVKLVAQTF